jgi:hypothetical protein
MDASGTSAQAAVRIHGQIDPQNAPQALSEALLGAENIDFLGVSQKAPAEKLTRCPVASTPATTIGTTAVGAFILPSFGRGNFASSAFLPLLRNRTSRIRGLQIVRAPIAHRCIG